MNARDIVKDIVSHYNLLVKPQISECFQKGNYESAAGIMGNLLPESGLYDVVAREADCGNMFLLTARNLATALSSGETSRIISAQKAFENNAFQAEKTWDKKSEILGD